ncbi:hypothetical protein Tco_0888702 [Tanacetum coccineum]
MNQNYDPNFCYDPIYSGFDQYQPPQFPEIHYPPQTTDKELLQARENLIETIQAFLKEYDRIPPDEKCMALLLAEERFLKIKQAVEEEQNQPEVIADCYLSYIFWRNTKGFIGSGEISEIKHAFTDKQYQQEDIQELMSKLLEDVRNINEELSEFINSPNLPIEEPDNSLSIWDEHLNIIPETEKSSVENLVPIPNSSITSPKIDFLPEEFVGELDFIDLILPGIDEDDFDEEDFDDEEEGIDNDILQIEDEILREKLLNVNLLVNKIEALKLTPFIPFVLKNPPSSPIPVVDSDFLVEEVDTFLVSEDLIPSGIESDLDSEGDIVFLDDLLYEDLIPEYERFTFDIEPDAPVINNFDELNEDECFDPEGGEIDVSQNIEDDNSFAIIIRNFLPYLTYPMDSPLLLSTGSEDIIFDPGIST